MRARQPDLAASIFDEVQAFPEEKSTSNDVCTRHLKDICHDDSATAKPGRGLAVLQQSVGDHVLCQD